jgi:hypothetical protein
MARGATIVYDRQRIAGGELDIARVLIYDG